MKERPLFDENALALKWGLKATLCNVRTIIYNCAHLWPFGFLSIRSFEKGLVVDRRGWREEILHMPQIQPLPTPSRQPLFETSDSKGRTFVKNDDNCYNS